MENSDTIRWVGKRVFLKLKNSNRAYSGYVISENHISLTIRDIIGHMVQINFDEIGLLQEQPEKN